MRFSASGVLLAEAEAMLAKTQAAGVTKLFVVQNGTAHERQVRLGSRGSAGMVEVSDGLEVDELVVTSGLTKLENGTAVSVKEAAIEPPL